VSRTWAASKKVEAAAEGETAERGMRETRPAAWRLVVLTGAITGELGGRAAAQTIGLVALLALAWLAFGSFLSLNAFEPLFWVGSP
jgi:hypothetical protein